MHEPRLGTAACDLFGHFVVAQEGLTPETTEVLSQRQIRSEHLNIFIYSLCFIYSFLPQEGRQSYVHPWVLGMIFLPSQNLNKPFPTMVPCQYLIRKRMWGELQCWCWPQLFPLLHSGSCCRFSSFQRPGQNILFLLKLCVTFRLKLLFGLQGQK